MECMMTSTNIFHSRKHSWPLGNYVGRATLQALENDPGAPPPLAWRRKLNSHANFLKEFKVTFWEALRMLGLGLRLWNYAKAEQAQGRIAPIDPFNRKTKPSACHGVPLGGMGAGSIGRGFRGEFGRVQLIPGVCEEAPVPANQFSAFITRGDGKRYSSVLSSGYPQELGKKDDKSGISSWDWNLDGQHSSYHALFPRAWTIYDGEPDPNMKISCRQISPFIPHNYKESSLPVCVFSYALVNTGKDTANASLLFTWANSIGGTSQYSGGHINTPFIEEDGVCGVLLYHKTAKGYPSVTFAISAQQTEDISVSVCPCFLLSGRGINCSARDMWLEVKQHGSFSQDNWNVKPFLPSLEGSSIGAAVAAAVVIPPHETRTIVFALAWDCPETRFQKGRSYHRRYTQFYGTFGNAAANLAHDAILDHWKWEKAIENWQNPILTNDELPEWYRVTLFNELYFLVAGGTIWTDGLGTVHGVEKDMEARSSSTSFYSDEEDSETDGDGIEKKINIIGLLKEDGKLHQTHGMVNKTISNSKYNEMGSNSAEVVPESTEDGTAAKILKAVSATMSNVRVPFGLAYGTSLLQEGEENVGQFLYLEGVEYRMWSTYDVHFYASFALLALFPELELSIQRDFAAATLSYNPEKVRFLAGGGSGMRKVLGAVPHDLGLYDPWVEVNAYNVHDTSKWKDLNSKFVLQIHRDIVITGNKSFARAVWPAVYSAMAYMDRFDRDRDCMIENDRFPDQTYDTWSVSGVSAYCGGLWLAALQAAAAIADEVNDQNAADCFRAKFLCARKAYEEKLWNGAYFSYDEGSSSCSSSIQADQMAGQWYMWASGLCSLFDDNKAQSALDKVFEFNVIRMNGGKMGAVNGMQPNGRVDESCMQSREIWAGTTYAIAATMIYAGMRDKAFVTAEGVFQAAWSEDGYGYWFQTPEAWTVEGHFRSLTYMRPLAIWAMQWALYPPKRVLEAPRIPSMDGDFGSLHHIGFARIADALKMVPGVQVDKINDLFSYMYGCACREGNNV
eukprot:c29353_g1_i1 orf=734-3784(+)